MGCDGEGDMAILELFTRFGRGTWFITSEQGAQGFYSVLDFRIVDALRDDREDGLGGPG